MQFKKIRNNVVLYTWFLWSIASILWLLFVIFPLSKKVDNLQLTLNRQQAQSTLMSYFSYVEGGELEKAYSLFSEEKKSQHTLEWFKKRLEWFVAFEWLKITELTEKNSAIQKVYLAEFWFKKRWMLSIPTKRWFYVKYNWDADKWEINYSNILYDENWRNSGACNFYDFDICK